MRFTPFIPSHFWQAQAWLSDPRDDGELPASLRALQGQVREPAATRVRLVGVGDACVCSFSFPRSCICVDVLFQGVEKESV